MTRRRLPVGWTEAMIQGDVVARFEKPELAERSGAGRRWSAFVRRTLDVTVATFGLLAAGIVYLWYARRLRRESPGPVLLPQTRVGKNGKHFVLYKFRTMVHGSEEQLGALLTKNEMNGLVFKMRDDPRIVPTGRTLRKYYLDELPQFYNVLRGDMTLVGPRPPLPSEVALYEPHHFRRLLAKPGITGPWQVQGNERISDFEKIVELDCAYIESASLAVDARLLAKTLGRVLSGDGW